MYALHIKSTSVRLDSKLGQIGPNWGQIWDFLRSVSVHFGSGILSQPWHLWYRELPSLWFRTQWSSQQDSRHRSVESVYHLEKTKYQLPLDRQTPVHHRELTSDFSAFWLGEIRFLFNQFTPFLFFLCVQFISYLLSISLFCAEIFPRNLSSCKIQLLIFQSTQ